MAKRLSNFFRGFLSQVRGEWRQMSCSHSEARASPPGNVFASKHGPNVRSNHRTSNLHNPFKKNEKIRITRVFAGFCPILIFGHDFVSNHSSYFFQINSQHQGPHSDMSCTADLANLRPEAELSRLKFGLRENVLVETLVFPHIFVWGSCF